jgi:hypothetical protein
MDTFMVHRRPVQATDFVNEMSRCRKEIDSDRPGAPRLRRHFVARIPGFVNSILFRAVKERASDIHIEPYEKETVYRFRINGRTKQFINAFGEELMVGDADKALADACQLHHAVVTDYTAGPVYFQNSRGRGGHEWVVEFRQAPDNVESFARILDESLQRINSDYEAKRYKNLALAPLRLHAVPPGTFNRWMKAKGKFGGQSKVPRLANNRQFLDELLPYARAVG